LKTRRWTFSWPLLSEVNENRISQGGKKLGVKRTTKTTITGKWKVFSISQF